MQRFGSLILLFVLAGSAQAEGFDHLLQTANQIVRLSEEMVYHGSEGHLHEIIDNGAKMIKAIDRLAGDLKSLKLPHQKALQNSIRATRDKTEAAIRLGKRGDLSASLASAKSASFHAKKVREALR
ncbi:MAG: hypothetical protein HY201_01270 [Nitrospirae bacterium]|nr:hypothetical protein [Candidatus Troglogloeales bacterium]MBI3598079.1 hypothetical protein [Candidatus Troglogloeales bacterium]